MRITLETAIRWMSCADTTIDQNVSMPPKGHSASTPTTGTPNRCAVPIAVTMTSPSARTTSLTVRLRRWAARSLFVAVRSAEAQPASSLSETQLLLEVEYDTL